MREYFMSMVKQFTVLVAVLGSMWLIGYLTTEKMTNEEIIAEQKIVIRGLKAEIELALDYKYRLGKCKRMHEETLRQLGLLDVDKSNREGM